MYSGFYDTSFDISIHAPTGGATALALNSWASINISIHAPTGGATDKPDTNADIIVISIHAPTGGATHFNDRYYNDFTEFQSTLPRGERLYPPLALNGDGADISIHAPTGGATKRITLIMADRTSVSYTHLTLPTILRV